MTVKPNRKIIKCNISLLILLFFNISFSFTSAIAQSQAPRIYEEKGEELLKKASDKLRSFNSLEIKFSYVMENERQNILEKLEGGLVSKGEKYRMKVGDNVFISDGTTIWAYMEDLDEVHISLVEDADGAMTPTAILDEFDTQFKVTFIRQEQYLGKPVDIIDLVPNAPQAFFKYRIALDARDSMMVYAIAYDRHGGTYTYSINRFITNPTVEDKLFTFSASQYPGVEIIDLR